MKFHGPCPPALYDLPGPPAPVAGDFPAPLVREKLGVCPPPGHGHSSASGEYAENVYRKDFTPSEALEEIERKAAKERQAELNRPSACGNFPQAEKGKARDKVAARVGMSGRTYEKARTVIQAAEREPEGYGDLVERMDRQGRAGVG